MAGDAMLFGGMNAEMNAAYITEKGDPGVIRHARLPIPRIGPTDVLVRVEAVAVDPVDTLIRSGAYDTPTPFPFVIGRDLVGTVVDAGPGAVGHAPGSRVWCASLGHGGRQGSFAEYAAVAADRLYPASDNIAADDLVAAAHPAATAWLALIRHGRLRVGETVYVGGGAGNVGSAAVALAARAGARVVASARPEEFAGLRSLGAARVLDYRAPDCPNGRARPRPTATPCTWTPPAATIRPARWACSPAAAG